VSLDRDIARAIKDVLNEVNEVSKKHQGDPRMREYKKVKCEGAHVRMLMVLSAGVGQSQESIC